MNIAIRKEPNGTIYIDKSFIERFGEIKLSEFNYKLVVVDDSYSDCLGVDFNSDLTFSVDKYNARKLHEINTDRISELKDLLSRTDYQAIKYAEGQITIEEYEPIKVQRQSWRDEINSLGG